MLTVPTQMSAFVAGVPYLHSALGREAQRDRGPPTRQRGIPHNRVFTGARKIM
jgi:hypothetical protein